MPSDDFYTLMTFGLVAVMCLGALAVFGLGAFFIVRSGVNRTKVVNQSWETLARGKGLTFVKGGYPKISGEYQGRQVELRIVNPRYDFDGPVQSRLGRTSSSRILITRTSAAVEDKELELAIYEKGLLDTAESSALGNEAFDSKFRVTCNAPARVKAILTPEMLSGLLDRNIRQLNIHQGMLSLNAVGFESRPEVLDAFLDLACRMADGIEKR